MIESDTKTMVIKKSRTSWLFFVLVAIGVATFIFGLTSQHPERAWQAYLINFLLWSAIAQGAVALTPLDYDMTKQKVLGEMSSWRFRLDDSITAGTRETPPRHGPVVKTARKRQTT